MKNIFFILLFLTAGASAQNKTMESRILLLEDRVALKNLVDTFSVLADQKRTDLQVFLFTEDATVESYMQGRSTGVIKGNKQLGVAFAGFLKQFDVVYHLNGQQTVNIAGDKAEGTSYCLVVLIGTVDGKKIKTTMGVYYNDQYVKQGGKWLISKRVSHFTWTQSEPLDG